MDVLVADADAADRQLLEFLLPSWGYRVVSVRDGETADEALRASEAPALAVLAWMLPGVEGPDICRRVRQVRLQNPPYLILLTRRQDPEGVVQGLAAGADDYLTKPFDPGELLARLRVGERTLAARRELAGRIVELAQALETIQRLQTLPALCPVCKRIRSDDHFWVHAEDFVRSQSGLQVTHGICPACLESLQQTHTPPPTRSY